MNQRPPIQCYKCNGPHKVNECPQKVQARQPIQCYGYAGPHYYKDYPYTHNNAPPVTSAVDAANVPLCSGYGINHLYKDCSMRPAPVDASNPRTTSLNLLGIECRRIAQVP